MKHLLALITCILLPLFSAWDLSGQEQTLMFPERKMKIADVFSAIEKQTDYTVAYNESVLDAGKVVTVPERKSLTEVLTAILKDTGTQFSFQGKMILIQKMETAKKAVTYTGKVIDETGPVIGAAVIVNQTGAVSVTDSDGAFSIKAPSGSTVKVSMLGYKDSELVLGIKTDGINIVLEEDNSLLDESVVVGYASMKKRDLVGAVDQIGGEAIASRPNGNLARSLQGEVAGLNITFTDSKPSRSASFNVRGETSVGAGGSTLVLIDGVEGSLNTINPQDVASVTVLKDASSTAVYGARGAFGVILVTTKDPQKGRPVINYNGSVTVNSRTVVPDVITDGLTWLNWWKDSYNGYYNGSKSLLNHIDSTVPYTEEIYNELVRRQADPTLTRTTTLSGHGMFGWAYMESTDWYDLFYKNCNWSDEHNLSVSGGNEFADYYVSGRYYGMDGIYKVGNEDYKKYDIRAKGTLKVRPWLKITNNISASVVNHYEPKHSRNDMNVQKAINHAGMPLSPVKNPDGTWTTAAAISGYAAFVEGTSYRTNDYVYLREKISADADIIKDVLKAQADYSFNYTARKRVDVQTPIKYSKTPGVTMLESESAGSAKSQSDYSTRYQAANAYLTYTPRLGDSHSLTALAGWNIEEQKYETLTVSRSGLITDRKPSFSLMDGTPTAPVEGGNAWSYVGVFYRLNYSYKGKYLVEFSGRYDGSSKFPMNSKWGIFPSGSIGWRISDEPWMKWASAMDNAKIRLSAGSMGNGNVSPYSYTSSMFIATAGDFVLGGELPSYTSVGSTVPVSLTWEKATTYDAGIDLDFFRNRLSFSGDIYRRYTTDMYTASESLPSVFGTTPPKGNNAELKTDGFELTLSWKDEFKLLGKPFSYNVKAMLWDSKSIITKYANDTGSLGNVKGYIKNGGSPSTCYVGMTIGEIWGYTVDGLFKDQDDIDASAVHNFQQASDKMTRPGQVKIKDLDGNGVIDPGNFMVHDHGDLTIIGNKSPRYRFGINLGANWNGIGLSVFLQGVLHRDWYPGSDSGYFWGKYGRPFFSFIPSIHAYTDDVYSAEKNNWDTAYWPRITTYQSNGTYSWTKVLEIPNTRYIQNAGYLRVKNIQLDYSFNKKLCERIGLQGLKVYLTGENLFTFTPLHKYAPNYDPEGLSFDSDFASAADGYTYPVLKSVTLGLNISF